MVTQIIKTKHVTIVHEPMLIVSGWGYCYLMSNLVPEPRVDVNGRVVTRHVRSGAVNHPANRSDVPPVPTGARSDTHRAVADLVYGTLKDYEQMRLYSPIYKSDVHLDRRTVTDYFSGMPKDIVEECLTQILSSETDEGYATLLVSAVHRREERETLSNMTFFYDHDNEHVATTEWDNERSIAGNHLYLQKIIQGMEKYTAWGIAFPRRLRLASVKQQHEALALYRTTDLISFDLDQKYLSYGRSGEGDVVSISLRDRALFDAVVTNHDRIDEIISVMKSRGCDGELLEEYLSGNPPLRHGVL
jgi:hypothetical protein